ncbi:MAG: phage tail assembly protein [Synergistaceae bacterium]|nr:phage tail assembly protein [Synergistaceae bacterium]
MKIKLTRELSVRGESLTELELDLDKLTGQDIIEVEKQIDTAGDGRALVLPEYSKVYLAAVAARALKVPREALNLLTARDFTRLTQAVQNFLMRPDLETEPDLKAEETVRRKS